MLFAVAKHLKLGVLRTAELYRMIPGAVKTRNEWDALEEKMDYDEYLSALAGANSSVSIIRLIPGATALGTEERIELMEQVNHILAQA